MQINVYLAVTADKYELPLYVADTPAELAGFMGRKKTDVLTMISRHTKSKGMRLERIEIDVLSREMA